MGNDVANCPFCEDGLIVAGFEPVCDQCHQKWDGSLEELSFGSRIDNNRYRKRIGLEELDDDY